jgi:hypothetical protein
MTIKQLLDLAFYPLLFAVFPVISLFAHNVGELTIEQLNTPLIFSLIFMLILWSLWDFFLQNKMKSALISTLIFFLLFSYGHIKFLIINTAANLFRISPDSLNKLENSLPVIFLLALVASTIIFFIMQKKLSNKLQLATNILNVISLSILIIPLTTISLVNWQRLSSSIEPLKVTNTINNQSSAQFPDIYYIIVERYADDKVLKESYGFDNSDFINFLQEKGFYIADSYSNYPFTATSLASSLNMKYLDDYQSQFGKASTDQIPLASYIENNETVKFLKSRGYKYLHFGHQEVPLTEKNANADLNYIYTGQGNAVDFSRFSRLLLDQSAYIPIVSLINQTGNTQFINPIRELRWRYYNVNLDQFNQLSKNTSKEGPKFVFVHTFVTHDPFVFDSDGTYIPFEKANTIKYQDFYIREITYLNSLLKDLVENILKQSKTPPIIIIQADEGPYPEKAFKNMDEFDWKKAGKKELKEKSAIFNAYYLPGVNSDKLYPGITPVNTFRMIFSHYFNEDFPLLEDKIYAQVDNRHPYDVFEITNLIK